MKKRNLLIGLVAVAAAAYYFTPSLSSIVTNLVHKYGSEVIGTDVNLGGFDLSLTKGEASLDKFTIANPKNYKEPYLFDLTQAAVKIDLKSLASDTIVIESIDINKPQITYEMLSLTQNNFQEIQNNINNYLAKSKSGSSADEAKSTEEKEASASSKKVVIKRLTITEANLAVAAGKQDISVTLPTIELKNIGEEKASSGTSIPQVIANVMTKILKVASDTVVKQNLNKFKDVAQQNLEEVVGGVKDRVKSLGIFGN